MSKKELEVITLHDFICLWGKRKADNEKLGKNVWDGADSQWMENKLKNLKMI